MSKLGLLEQLRQSLRDELDHARRVARATAADANHPEARPENDKDTRKIELSYLAMGQATRARELEAAITMLAAVPTQPLTARSPVAAGALVAIEVAGKPQRVFLAPSGGGTTLRDARGEVRVVTPSSPLGRALLGRTRGDVFDLEIGGKPSEVEIVEVE
jgi:transcription elongation GreA/GreB family factor